MQNTSLINKYITKPFNNYLQKNGILKIILFIKVQCDNKIGNNNI